MTGSDDFENDNPRDERDELELLLLDVADKFEMAATNLKSGNMDAAGTELRNAAWQIQAALEKEEDDDAE